MEAIITITTDFGICDAYLAAMKGVILSINPKANIVDLCHAISPQNIAMAAFMLGTTYRYFPQGTIHVVVVDPGVGSKRRAIILSTAQAFFVAPDNSVLSYIVGEACPQKSTSVSQAKEELFLVAEKRLGWGLQAISLTNPKFWHHPVSPTFHGRDIFAPVAAHLSRGVPLEQFGEAISSVLVFPIPHPQIGAHEELIGHIIYIDHFGNLITDAQEEDLPSTEVWFEIAGRRIEGVSPCYAEGGELLALIDSSGHVEIAAKNSSAAELLGVDIGDEVQITPAKTS